MKIVAIVNQKGGVGKTTSSVFIADALNSLGYKVLLVDLDPQRNATFTYKAQYEDVATVYDVLTGEVEAKEAIQHTENGDIIPSDKVLVSQETMFQSKMGREFFLKNALKSLEGEYDFHIFDTPPNPGVYTVNALTAADGCVIPVKCDDYSILAMQDIQEIIDDARKSVNPELKVYGVFPVVYDQSRAFHKQFVEALPKQGETYGFHVFKTAIRKCADVDKARTVGASLQKDAPKSNGAKDYLSLTKELIKEVKKEWR